MRSRKPLTEVHEFKFNVDTRAIERAEFDKKVTTTPVLGSTHFIIHSGLYNSCILYMRSWSSIELKLILPVDYASTCSELSVVILILLVDGAGN